MHIYVRMCLWFIVLRWCFRVFSVYMSTSKYVIPLYFHSPLSVGLERFYCIEFQRSNFLQLHSHFYQSINQSVII